ncbi:MULTISPECIES: hypothetical protein [unclassified Streptomyces]|uniref:hypothetical protein n=1 Tax=unclassified Streptomyces TaxID=2593676 RepID=UPI0036616DCB
MSRRNVPHAFTAVDSQSRPAELVEVLKRLTAEPFVEARTLVVRDPTPADNVMGLRSWAHTAAADRFVAQFDQAVRTGRFTYAVTFFLTSGNTRGIR